MHSHTLSLFLFDRFVFLIDAISISVFILHGFFLPRTLSFSCSFILSFELLLTRSSFSPSPPVSHSLTSCVSMSLIFYRKKNERARECWLMLCVCVSVLFWPFSFGGRSLYLIRAIHLCFCFIISVCCLFLLWQTFSCFQAACFLRMQKFPFLIRQCKSCANILILNVRSMVAITFSRAFFLSLSFSLWLFMLLCVHAFNCCCCYYDDSYCL